jgi:hypothetical protein
LESSACPSPAKDKIKVSVIGKNAVFIPGSFTKHTYFHRIFEL